MAICPSASGIRPLSICVEMLRSSGRGVADSVRGGESSGKGKASESPSENSGKGKASERSGRFGKRNDTRGDNSQAVMIKAALPKFLHPAGTVDESNLVIDDGEEWMRFVVDSDGCPSDDDDSGPIPDLVTASGSDSSDAGIGHDTGVRRLHLRGGGPPLAAGPDDNNHLVDAEFDVEAWQLNGGV